MRVILFVVLMLAMANFGMNIARFAEMPNATKLIPAQLLANVINIGLWIIVFTTFNRNDKPNS